jgi:anaerobic ribonucleoside-triphosphate reductase activating protein
MLKYVHTRIVWLEVPNETTLAIDIANCPFRCKGCHSPELQEDVGFDLTFDLLDSFIEKVIGAITCVCFMGGDSEPAYINELLKHVKEKYKLKTAWYSGKDNISYEVNMANLDYYKIGHYDERLGPISSKHTNQIMLKVSENGRMSENITRDFWSKK